jgi:hypothetical protein
MKQTFLVVVWHVQHNHPLAPSGKWEASGSKNQGYGNETIDLQ